MHSMRRLRNKLSEWTKPLNLDWHLGLLSNFIATVLGIVMTLGVDDYLDRQSRKDYAHEMLLAIVDDLKEQRSDMLDAINRRTADDSLYVYILSCYDQQKRPEKDSLDSFLQHIASVGQRFGNNYTEQLLLANDELLESLNDLELVKKIANSYNAFVPFNKDYDRLVEYRQRLRDKMPRYYYDKHSMDSYNAYLQLMQLPETYQCILINARVIRQAKSGLALLKKEMDYILKWAELEDDFDYDNI